MARSEKTFLGHCGDILAGSGAVFLPIIVAGVTAEIYKPGSVEGFIGNVEQGIDSVSENISAAEASISGVVEFGGNTLDSFIWNLTYIAAPSALVFGVVYVWYNYFTDAGRNRNAKSVHGLSTRRIVNDSDEAPY